MAADASRTARTGRDGPVARDAGFVALGATTLVILWCARGYLDGRPPLGYDASSHVTTIATLAERIATGAGWWSNDYNLGFPLALYYQPLPHIVSALATIAGGGQSAAPWVYKLFATLLHAALPWTTWWGLRRAGLRHVHAAFAGALAPTIIHSIGYGFESHATLTVGLYTQLWGQAALPLALGEWVALARGRGAVWTTMAASVLLAATHMFFAIAIAPLLAVAFLVAHARSLGRGLGLLVATGGGAAFALAWWLVPMWTTRAYMGGWPFGRDERVDGYGWAETLRWLTSGEALDGADAFPLLSGLAAAGLVLLAWRLRRAPHGLLVALVVWSLLGTIGRAGLGAAVDIYPLHESVQLFRYVALAQFALVVCAGVAVGELARTRWSLAPRVAFPILAAVLVTLALHRVAPQLEEGFATTSDAPALHLTEYDEAAGWLRELPDEGRVYIHRKVGIRGHYHSGLLAYTGDHALGQSYGVGLHDSLHFYTLEFIDPRQDRDEALTRLFDFRWALHAPSQELDDPPWELLRENDRYALSTLSPPHAPVSLMRVASTIHGTPRTARVAIRRWMNGDGPSSRATVELVVDDPASGEAMVGAPVTVDGEMELPPGDRSVGRVLVGERGSDRIVARVRAESEAAVIAKTSFHPFWRATVDGERVEPFFAFPGLLAVAVPAGEHAVEWVFRRPPYAVALAWAAPLPLVIAWSLRSLRRRRSANSTPQRSDDPAGFP